MEECLDQDVEIIIPPPKDASFVYRSAEQLSSRHGPSAICSVPLRRKVALAKKADRAFESDVVAVLCMERTADKPFTIEELETLRLTADLFTARLVDLYEQDKWIGAKALRESRKAFSWIVGPKHTWAKMAALAVSGLIAFALLVSGANKVESPFVLEASDRQVVSAPYDGELESVGATAGDFVLTPATGAHFDLLNTASPLVPLVPFRRPASVLATLKTYELKSKLIGAKNDKLNYDKQAQLARSPKEGPPKEAEAQMAEAESAKAQSQINLYAEQIEQASIKAPVDGVVLSGDLKSKIGAPVKLGDELFQVGPHELRAELSVPDDQIADLSVQQHGELAASSFPEQHLGFTVQRIFPKAEVTSGKNVFKVRVVLDAGATRAWMKPGMEGIAKVHVGEARYAWIWTHRLVNWVRMKLWM
jgi:multidrug efflux pump subunit AcrA (membrane-fusion protein)